MVEQSLQASTSQANEASKSNSFISLMAKHSLIEQGNMNGAGRDELDRYLADKCVPTDNALQWWIISRNVYPNLAKFAISLHLIPGVFAAIVSQCLILTLL